MIQIVIEDTGIGIPEDKKEKIFEHFSRLSPSYEGRYTGYGLGLYTVKRYLEAMKGNIKVESELGKGSRFILTIPFKIGKEVSSEITRVFEQEVSSNRFSPELVQVISSEEKEIPSKGTKILSKEKSKEKTSLEQSPETVSRILLVEDNRLAALMATRLLAERHCEIVHVETGADALERITQERFDLILMDLGLPDQSGMEVAQKIRARADHLNVNVPIIALTGHLSNDQRQACIAAGMQDMLIKPLTALTGQQLLMKYGSTATDSLNTLKLQEPEISTKFSVIDLERGMNILGGDLAGAKEALDLLAQSLPMDFQQIQMHYNAKDYEALYQVVHKLYGGLCYCGTPSLQEVTHSLKQALLEKKIKKLPLLMQYLQKELERFQQAHQHLKQQEEF